MADNSEAGEAIREINRLIENLVNNMIGSSSMIELVYSQNRTGFEFNILKSYLETGVSLAISAHFVKISAGQFTMGSPRDEPGRYDNEQQHVVTLDQDFEMQTTEVTQLQYYRIMGSNPVMNSLSKEKDCPGEYRIINGTGLCPKHPVEVSWDRAQDFIINLNNLSTNGGGYVYRLPTEAEWEYAARAGTTTAFNLGDTISPEQVNYNGHYGGQTVSVASLPNANNWGLYDMHGNAWEWVDVDQADKDTLFTDKKCGMRRGGGSRRPFRDLRSANRYFWSTQRCHFAAGIRLVRTPKK